MFIPLSPYYENPFSFTYNYRIPIEERQIFLSGKSIPEYIQITNPSFNNYVLTINSFINNKWETIFQKNYPSPVRILAVGNLLRDKRQQIVIGNYFGSSETLKFEVLGWNNGRVKFLLNQFIANEGFPFGTIDIKDNVIYVSSSTQGKIYLWEGEKFISYPYIDNPDPKLIRNNDIVIYYVISEDKKVISSIPNNSKLILKQDQRVFLIRGNFGPIERILISGDTLDFKNKYIYITQVGKGIINIIPDGYDTENSISFNVEILP
ncbi:hypothetical protein NLI92_002871 [Priestia megaterium]|uniref:hypothetical protein n=1 Tax=Priestia megaterium TaxID=1404 RepID=UPI0021AC58CB|nr:hypothetical protein [Priestia megaterium]MCR8927482.1 hypothetical protein [Priestia megaterium]